MSTNRSKLSWRTAAAVAAASAVIGVGAWSAFGEESPGSRLDARAERIMHGRETIEFANLEQLVGSTPYIVKATVTDIQPGRSTGDEDSGGVEQARDVTLSVETSYKKALLPSTLVVEEWGWDEDGAGYQVENVAWSKIGDEGYYFLTRSTTAGHYKLVNTQGRALETSDGFLKLSADPESELTAAIGWMDSLDFGLQIRYLLQPENSDQLETVSEPPAAPSASQTEPAADDGSEEPYPDDSVDDGSEPSASPTSG
ncbi:hypothetical protein [Streptomyces sp. NBC_00620]|uniref:hypothetical protein n=1 Tax=Streptomyces sp. NBC_00620 TaxID=2903666 RepID=UPI00224EC470|nr:hypothetical protein [Streptomyces sp. NBC_00620]MCX4974459.1 hypothetical protein [Streptomyces sp. NBC_00620]